MDLKSKLYGLFGWGPASENPESENPNETPDQHHKRELKAIKNEFSKKSMRLSTCLLRMKNLARSLDREEIFANITEITSKLLDAERVQLLLNDPTNKKFIIVSAEGMLPREFSQFQVPYESGGLIPYLVYLAENRPQENISALGIKGCADNPETKGLIGKGILKTIIALPIWVDRKLFAVLNVEKLKNPDYSQDEFKLVSLCAEIASLTLKNSFLLSEAGAETAAAESSSQEKEKMNEELKSCLSHVVPPKVANLIMQDPTAFRLETTCQDTTILVSNIRKFTEYSELIPPCPLVEQLNEYFPAMIKVMLETNGTLDKFLGDGLMTLFGPPLLHTNAAVSAVLCALKMRDALIILHQSWKEQDKPLFEFGIGISSGEVAAGYLGSEEHLSYTVIGAPANLAHQLTSQAKPMQILVSEATFERVKDFFEIETLSPIQLKGRSKPVAVFAVLGIKPGVNLEDHLHQDNAESKLSPETLKENLKIDSSKVISCFSCGNENDSQDKYCLKCGMPLF